MAGFSRIYLSRVFTCAQTGGHDGFAQASLEEVFYNHAFSKPRLHSAVASSASMTLLIFSYALGHTTAVLMMLLVSVKGH